MCSSMKRSNIFLTCGGQWGRHAGCLRTTYSGQSCELCGAVAILLAAVHVQTLIKRVSLGCCNRKTNSPEGSDSILVPGAQLPTEPWSGDACWCQEAAEQTDGLWCRRWRQQQCVLPAPSVTDSALLCVLCGSQNKQRLFPYTALTDWFL
jgi:hypothetical protein